MHATFPNSAFSSAEAFVQEVYKRHQHWTLFLYGQANKNQRHLIEDVLQEFYITVFRKWNQIPHENHYQMFACLYKMLRNEHINQLRRERSCDHLEDLSPPNQPTGSIYHLCYTDLLEDTFKKIEQMVSPQDFEILQMKTLGWLSEDIAEKLDVKRSFVDVRLHRTRKKLYPYFA